MRGESWTSERYAQKNDARRTSRGPAGSRTRREYNAMRFVRRTETRNGAFGHENAGLWNRLIIGTTGDPRGSGRTDEEENE